MRHTPPATIAKSRIGYLINRYPAISHAFIRREIHALERQGVDVVRVALRGWEGELADEIDLEERAKTRYVLRHGPVPLLLATIRIFLQAPRAFLSAMGLALRMGWGGQRPIPVHLIYLAEASQLLLWLQEAGVEHVHAHFGTNSAEIVMLARVLGGPPYSFTLHGPLEFDSAHPLGLAEKVHHAEFVVAITSYTRSQLYRCSHYRDWPKIEVVHCGLQPEIFQRPAVLPPASPRLVCIGRLVEQKGQKLLVEAAAELARRGVDFKLVLVGGGPMRDELIGLVQTHRLDSQVELLGAVPTERLYEELELARGLVLPSFAEGLPMVIMEAMALRRPVISTYIAGIPELIRDGQDGWLIPAGSVEHLADAMQRLAECPLEQLVAMGNAAYSRVRERHCSDAETRKLAALFCRSDGKALANGA
jgi:colanic acid/amylovoran biosynthesis glycosyltransferase